MSCALNHILTYWRAQQASCSGRENSTICGAGLVALWSWVLEPSLSRKVSFMKKSFFRVGPLLAEWIFRGFLFFRAAGFFSRICHRMFSPHFCGKNCPEKSSRKIPPAKSPRQNPPKYATTRIPDQSMSAEGPGQELN